MSWSDKYIGIPQADHGRSDLGCDCWGLLRLVYARELGIALPGYEEAYLDPGERREIAALIDRAEASGPWRRATQPRPFQLLLFRRGRWRSHVGLRVSAARMLHMDGMDQARIADLRDGYWRARLVGEYRHVEMETPS